MNGEGQRPGEEEINPTIPNPPVDENLDESIPRPNADKGAELVREMGEEHIEAEHPENEPLESVEHPGAPSNM